MLCRVTSMAKCERFHPAWSTRTLKRKGSTKRSLCLSIRISTSRLGNNPRGLRFGTTNGDTWITMAIKPSISLSLSKTGVITDGTTHGMRMVSGSMVRYMDGSIFSATKAQHKSPSMPHQNFCKRENRDSKSLDVHLRTLKILTAMVISI